MRCLRCPLTLYFRSYLKSSEEQNVSLSGVILSRQNRTLTIQRVKKEDSGRYTCTACNRRGCETSQAVLTTEGQSSVHLVPKAK